MEKKPVFVIHKHEATHLHYDFRLEIGRVLKSWAIPKRPSADPDVKRLAISTPNHPLSYKNFKGTIPEGEYGAGKVSIWDKGTYENLRDVSMSKSYKEGKIVICLKGKRLKGNYTLVRMKRSLQPGKPPQWLLIKMKH